jgi:hypothetical protein
VCETLGTTVKDSNAELAVGKVVIMGVVLDADENTNSDDVSKVGVASDENTSADEYDWLDIGDEYANSDDEYANSDDEGITTDVSDWLGTGVGIDVVEEGVAKVSVGRIPEGVASDENTYSVDGDWLGTDVGGASDDKPTSVVTERTKSEDIDWLGMVTLTEASAGVEMNDEVS